MTTLTPEDRDELRALAEKATPGPWLPHARYVWTSELGGIIQNWSDDANAAADMEFIAAARAAVPALLDMLDQTEARIQAVEALCDAAEDPDQWPPRPVIHGGEPFPASLMVDAIRRALEGW